MRAYWRQVRDDPSDQQARKASIKLTPLRSPVSLTECGTHLVCVVHVVVADESAAYTERSLQDLTQSAYPVLAVQIVLAAVQIILAVPSF